MDVRRVSCFMIIIIMILLFFFVCFCHGRYIIILINDEYRRGLLPGQRRVGRPDVRTPWSKKIYIKATLSAAARAVTANGQAFSPGRADRVQRVNRSVMICLTLSSAGTDYTMFPATAVPLLLFNRRVNVVHHLSNSIIIS